MNQRNIDALPALLNQALVDKWDFTKWLDQVIARAVVSTPEGDSELFDNAVREAWQVAGQKFGTADLLAGLFIAYNGAAKDGEV